MPLMMIEPQFTGDAWGAQYFARRDQRHFYRMIGVRESRVPREGEYYFGRLLVLHVFHDAVDAGWLVGEWPLEMVGCPVVRVAILEVKQWFSYLAAKIHAHAQMTQFFHRALERM